MKIANKAFFPLDKRWQLDRSRFSYGLSRELVWLGGLLPFESASLAFERFTGYAVPQTTLWEQAKRHGERLHAYEEQRREQVNIERLQWNHQDYDPLAYRSVSMDGGMIHIRQEGWKEMKVGLVSGLQHEWEREKPRTRLVHLDYTAVIGTVETFAPALWELSVRNEIPYAGRTAVVADGAAWIWRLCADYFPGSTQIVDWYHARQQLAHAAELRHPDNDVGAQRWYEKMSPHLFHGEVWKIIHDLKQHDISATYFQTHQRRMQYLRFRADGFPIGSGGVESGIKQYKQRLSGPGMRWSRQGAERMLTIRTAVLARHFDDLWEQAA